MKRRCFAAAASLLTAVCAFGALSVPQAHASPQFSRGFTITNASRIPLTLNTSLSGEAASGPAKGTILQPDALHHFEVTYYFFHDQFAVVDYYSGQDHVQVTLGVSQGIPGTPSAACTAWGPLSCRVTGSDIEIGDRA